MSDDEGVTHTRDVVVDEHWRPGSTIPERDTREVIDTTADDFERVPSVWEVDDCECGWSSGHRDTCLCGSVSADVLGEVDAGAVSR